jgi:RND family efflux transporter MFP subunit
VDLSTLEAVVTGASIHSLADGRSAVAESAAWTQFSSPSNTAEFCAGWLSILCAQVDRVSGALVLLGSGEDGNYGPVAAWPSQKHNLLHLGPVAEATLKERRGVVNANEVDVSATLVGYPIEVEGKLYGAVVLDVKSRSEPDVQRALRLVHWGSAWLIDHFRQQLMAHQRQNSLHTSLVNEIVATSLQEERLVACALAVANELATRMKCERVSIGFLKGDSIEVMAISNTATFDAKSDFVRILGDAMDEVLDLDLSIVHPPLEADAIGGLAHAGLSAARGEAGVMSVPLLEDSDIAGVLTLERSRGQAFSQSELALFKTIGMVLGPMFALKRREELGLRQRTWKALRGSAVATFGPGHPGLKLLTLSALITIVFLSVATSTYRVNSKTVIEGEVQRAVVAPFQGYVAESMVRAGDTVTKGQMLARLDDRELKLERARWASEAEQTHRKYRQAAAGQERAAMAISSAQEDQAQAQLALVDERLARARLLAPFDGVVVVGDLSQLLGSPVELGKVLFEVAPLDAYRVVLNVDERDIASVVPGQQGELALAGMPYDRLPFTVHKVTPISTAQDGRNYFRVEARLAGSTIRLRPGMEGIGKVQVGERKLIWIWTHTFVEWLRLEAWRWFG